MSVVSCMIVYMSKRHAVYPAVSLILGPRFPGRALHPYAGQGATCDD